MEDDMGVLKDIFISPVRLVSDMITVLCHQNRLFLYGFVAMGVVIAGLIAFCVWKKQFPVFKKTWFKDNFLFLMINGVLTVFMGLVIPVIIASSSPIEFYEGGIAPLLLVLHNFLLFFGLFMVYLVGIYALMPDYLKRLMECIGIFYIGVALVSFIGYGWKLGIMDVMFVYDGGVEYSSIDKLVSLLLAAIMLILPVILLKIKKSEPIFRVVLGILLIVGLWMGISNAFLMQNKIFKAYANKQTDEENQTIDFTRKGKNVVVIMLDRAIGRYLPFIVNEHPELAKQYDGFVYYPNMVSLAKSTNLSTPSLFGGYEYSPQNINKREGEMLVNKHNEALRVMPKMFSDNDFAVTVSDPPCANYQWTCDISIYDGMEGVKAINLIGKHMDGQDAAFKMAYDGRQLHNIAGYSIMRTLPAKLQKLIYDSGNYLSTMKPVYVSDVFMQSYTALTALPQLTVINDSGKNTFLMMQNSTSHEPSILQRPDYAPTVDEPKGVYEDMDRFSQGGVTAKMDDSIAQMQHYHINNAALLRLGDWLDYLKEQGIYDNTRIIIVSDHAFELNQFDDMTLKNGLDVEGINSLLLVKDFDSHGSLDIDDNLMCTADVPFLAAEGVIDKPVNPYTGNRISSDAKKDGVTITTSANWVFEGNTDNVWDLSDGEFWNVNGDILLDESWKKVN